MSEAADFELNVDLSGDDIGAWGGEGGPSVPPGIYVVMIDDVEQSSSRTSQQPTLKVTFLVQNEGEFFDRKIVKSYSLQQKALGRLKNLMMAVGARLDAIRKSDLVGKTLEIEVVHRHMDPQPQPDGSVKEGNLIGDVMNEKALEGAEAQAEPEPPPPPPKAETKAPAPTNAKASNVRRAVGQAKA